METVYWKTNFNSGGERGRGMWSWRDKRGWEVLREYRALTQLSRKGGPLVVQGALAASFPFQVSAKAPRGSSASKISILSIDQANSPVRSMLEEECVGQDRTWDAPRKLCKESQTAPTLPPTGGAAAPPDRETDFRAAARGRRLTVRDVQDALRLGLDLDAPLGARSGRTALMHAVAARAPGATAVVKYLIDSGADVDAKDKKGKTALMRAAQQGSDKMVKALLRRGADARARDLRGRTALDYCAGHRRKSGESRKCARRLRAALAAQLPLSSAHTG